MSIRDTPEHPEPVVKDKKISNLLNQLVKELEPLMRRHSCVQKRRDYCDCPLKCIGYVVYSM
jgi:hypothetical protein